MAAQKGRNGFRMSDAHRLKIQNSEILDALIEHAEGKRDMSSTQVSVATSLLKKIMPDVQATTIRGDADTPVNIKVTLGGNDS